MAEEKAPTAQEGSEGTEDPGITGAPIPPADGETAESIPEQKAPEYEFIVGVGVTTSGEVVFMNPDMGQKITPTDEQVLALFDRAKHIIERKQLFDLMTKVLTSALQTSASIGATAAADFLRGTAKNIVVPGNFPSGN